jgi:arginyl-tRNA synthetase
MEMQEDKDLDYKLVIAGKIGEILDVETDRLVGLMEVPPRPEMGDYAFPCFQLAKTLRKAPNAIATELKEKLDIAEVERIETLGPYLNFFLKKGIFTEGIITTVLGEKERYGSRNTGEGKNVVVEFSSPNIAKPFHVGHLFSTVVGSALDQIFSFEGYNSISINHLGDWGTQFGKLIAAYGRWVDKEALLANPIDELNRIYVKFHAEAEIDDSLNDVARLHFKNLEDGAEYEVGLWKEFRELSLKVFEKIYAELGISFKSYAGESFYSDKMDRVVDILTEKNLLKESNGAQVVMLDEYNMPPTIIKKADGATIYATRDLAAAIYRKDTYDFYKNIYVVGTPQSLHFKQIFKTLELAGFEWAKDCVHVGFGLVKFPGKQMSTRKGDIILLEDLLREATEKAVEIIEEKNPGLENKLETGKKVGIGAIIFTYLKNSREKDIIFDWKEMLSFEGETGPYVQYTYARAKSILRKNAFGGTFDASLLSSKEEFELAKTLGVFNDAVNSAIDKYEPSVITRYVIQVAKDFNKFYNNCPINSAEEDLKQARLSLVEATTIVISNALKLIGIETVERM